MAKISHVRGAFRGSPNAFVATPTYTGKVSDNYLYSLLYSIPRLQEAGIGFEQYTMANNCHVDDSRNGIVRDFLLSDCDQLIFIDADVSWEPEALVKLIKYDRDVVAGVYPKRTDQDADYPVHVEPGTTLRADKDGLVEVTGAPTGFMKIKRHVIEKMWKANEHRQFYGQGQGPGDDPYCIIFERTYEDGHRWSGDYNFCRQWKKMGGKVFVDPEMYLTHSGEIDFSGKLGDFWKRKHGVDKIEAEMKFNDAVENLKAGRCSEKDIEALVVGWGNPYSAGFELLSACYQVAKDIDPKRGPILETGSGLTTLVMALANPKIEVHALEHEIIWASRIKYFCDIYDIKNVVVHLCPLKQFESGKWYDIKEFPGDSFSFVLCDGPPRMISDRSILYKELGQQMKGAMVIMDDADDEAAVAPLKEWAESEGREVSVLGRKRQFAVSNVVKSCQSKPVQPSQQVDQAQVCQV